MLDKARDWLGFGPMGQTLGSHGHDHGEAGSHGHTHGVINASLTTSERGVWAIKWSFVILAITAALQFVVVVISGSVALLADMIHNVGDATTAIPLWIAFVLARRRPTKTFTYGLGKIEDFAGIIIVAIILISALIAGYEAINRFIHPQPIVRLWWVAAAGLAGFAGNEFVAVFRIRVGREMNSAALIADGYHARVDGLTSLAVVIGALGVHLGFPVADPIIGLLITFAIFGIVWQSSKAVLTRMFDGVEPGIIDEIRHAAEHVPGLERVYEVKARWMGHRLHADVAIGVADTVTVTEGVKISEALKGTLFEHLPALAEARIRLANASAFGERAGEPAHVRSHHHAPEPFGVNDALAFGLLEIVDTPSGERMRLTVERHAEGLVAMVIINRPAGPETLPLKPISGDHRCFESADAPAEPHEFAATLLLQAGDRTSRLPFKMLEPAGHHN